jgi:predicted esterase
VPLSRSRESADALRAAGAQVHERVYAARDHTVLDDEIAAAAALLRLQQSFDR